MEDVFDRFTDASKKRKRLERKKQQEAEKTQKIVESNKEYAADKFNDPLSIEEFTRLKTYIRSPVKAVKWLSQLWHHAQQHHCDVINYRSQETSGGVCCVFDYLQAAVHCQTWLNHNLAHIGWTNNCTGYDPVEVSNSTAEVLQATYECYKMAVKQMLQWAQKQKYLNEKTE